MPQCGFVILTLAFRKDGTSWLGRCQELSTSTYGRSIERVHDELIELIDLHLNALEQSGEREQFFRENQIKFYTDDQAEPEIAPAVSSVDREEYLQYHRMPVSGFD